MIRPSQKRNPKPVMNELVIHDKIKHRRYWHTRLLICSLFAAIASIGLWLSGVSLSLHFAGLIIAFLVGFAVPLKPSTSWVFNWIAQHIGLTYQTALELAEDDPYGFRQAITQKAKQDAINLDLPNNQRWWLPLLVVAVCLAAIPIAPFTGNLRSLVPLPGKNVTTNDQPSDSSQAAQPEPQADNATAPDTPPAIPPEQTNSPQALDEFSGSSGTTPESISDRVADAETLAKYLENLRESPEQQNQASQQPSPSDAAPNTPKDNARGQAPGTGESGDQQQQGSSNEEGGSQQNEAGANQENPQGQDQTGENGQQQDGNGQSQDAQADSPESGSSQQQGDNAAGNPTDSRASEGGLGQDQEGAMGDSAGNSSTAATPNPSNALSSEQKDPERIDGQLNSGPSNLAGTIRLPGTEQGQTLPGTGQTNSFSQANEQAITEGRIPVEYQEIIKNYFK